MRRVSIIFFLFVSIYTAYAVRAYPYPVEIIYPDGTRLTILIKGDEFFRYRTTLDGKIIAQGGDGFYYYADYNTGKLRISGERVTGFSKKPFALKTDNIPSEVIENTRRYNMELYSVKNADRADALHYTAAGKKVKALILLVEFSDVKFSILPARQHFEDMANLEGYSENQATGSIKDYFKDNLKGFIEPEFVVSDVISLPKELAYYGANQEQNSTIIKYDVNIRQMVYDACVMADANIDFSSFDNNKDGKVDNVFIFFAGYSEAEGGSYNSIWPLSWNMDSYSLVLDGVTVSSFACASELRGAAGNIPSGIGTFCHEFGHILGLKDLYDTDYEENGLGKGLWGSLSLMDFGCYNNKGRTPPYLTAIERELIGCGNVLSMEKGNTYTLEPVNINGSFYKVPTSTPNEYFLIEVREETAWDSHIGGEGMLIYHIDKSDNIAGSIMASVRWRTNTINTCSEHECAALEEAVPSATNVRQVFFPGLAGVSEFTSITNPPFAAWNLNNVGVKLVNIKYIPEGVSFRVEEDHDEKMLSILNPKLAVYQTEALLTWRADINIEAKWGVRWKLRQSPDESYSESIVSEKSFLFEGLEPGQDYSSELFYIGNNSNGDTLKLNFRTIEMTSEYPFIHGVKKEFHQGDTLRLKLFNIGSNASKIEWSVGGVSVPEGKYVLDMVGDTEIKARIVYGTDRSEEIITRKITILNKKEDETPE